MKIITKIISCGKGKSNTNTFWINAEKMEPLITGFGSIPEKVSKAAESGGEIELEFHKNTKDGKEYINYGPEKKQKGDIKGTDSEILRYLAMPKISVGFEKTIQESQYEPKRISVHISQNAESIDPARIDAMIKLAESRVMQKIDEGRTAKDEKPKLTEEQEKKAEEAVEDGFKENPNKATGTDKYFGN